MTQAKITQQGSIFRVYLVEESHKQLAESLDGYLLPEEEIKKACRYFEDKHPKNRIGGTGVYHSYLLDGVLIRFTMNGASHFKDVLFESDCRGSVESIAETCVEGLELLVD